MRKAEKPGNPNGAKTRHMRVIIEIGIIDTEITDAYIWTHRDEPANTIRATPINPDSIPDSIISEIRRIARHHDCHFASQRAFMEKYLRIGQYAKRRGRPRAAIRPITDPDGESIDD